MKDRLFLLLIFVFIFLFSVSWTFFFPKLSEAEPQEAVLVKSELKDNKYIFLVPVYGLGNRIRTMSDFYSFSKCFAKEHDLNYNYEVIWKKTADLSAPFSSLFSNPLLKNWNFENIDDYGILSQQDLKNLSSLLDVEVKKNVNYGQKMNSLHQRSILIHFRRHKHLFILSAWGFSVDNYDKSCYNEHRLEYFEQLRISSKVQEIMSTTLLQILSDKNRNVTVIGLHLRQTDFVENGKYKKSTASIQEMLAKVFEILVTNMDIAVFISADTEDSVKIVISHLLSKGMNKVYSVKGHGKYNLNGKAIRNSTLGMQYSTADLFLLSKCTYILANARKSSFSKLAADIGGIKRQFVI